MAEIADLERRITAALDRIGAGLGALQAPAPVPEGPSEAEFQAMQEAVEAERTANAQLEERVKTLHEQRDTLQAQLDALTAAGNDAKSQVQQLRKTNQHLQASLQTLREASASGVEPHLINQAMMSELDGLRSVRDADRAELDEILGALQPLLKEAQDA